MQVNVEVSSKEIHRTNAFCIVQSPHTLRHNKVIWFNDELQDSQHDQKGFILSQPKFSPVMIRSVPWCYASLDRSSPEHRDKREIKTSGNNV